MRLPEIAQTEFADFFEAVSTAFGVEWVYFHGSCKGTDLDEYRNWTFCLSNQRRSTELFVPSHLAFFFINLALSNISSLPNTLITQDVSYARLRYLHYKYGVYQLTHIQPFN